MKNSSPIYKHAKLSTGSLFVFVAAFFLFAVGPQTQANTQVAKKDNLIQLTAKFPEQIKKPKFWLRGKTEPGASLEFFLDGQSQGFLVVGKKGKFQKRVSLTFGTHTLQLVVESTNGTNSLSGDVSRMASRAYDMPLGLGIIHSYNETTSSILSFYGSAYGVDKVRVAVNDIDWGYIVVKKKSGHYKTKVRHSEGENTIAVTAVKSSENVTATKKVIKR